MADDIQVQLLGVAELVAGMGILAGMIDRAAQQAFEAVAAQVAGQVRGTVPRRTGALAASVTTAPGGDGTGVQMGAGVPYARFVEYGGRGFPHSSGNYLTPTAMAAEGRLEAAGVVAADAAIGAMQWPSPI